MEFTASESRWNDANSGGPPLGVGVAVLGNGRFWGVGNSPRLCSSCAHSVFGCGLPL